MATATRTAVKTRKTLESLAEQVDRMEQMLLLMMTKKQREEYDALFDEPDDSSWDDPVHHLPIAPTEAEINEQQPEKTP